jgi:thiol-disulfide isomerase/thioredoxin/YHS domain-containing protein
MPWQPNLEAAQQLAARTNRLVLIHFWAPWCQPCMRLEREVFSQAETGRALEPNFVLVKINSDDAPGTTRMYGVSSLPTDVIIQPNGRLVSQFQSPPTANQYVAQLNQAAAGHRELARKSSPQISSNAPAIGGIAPPAAAAPMAGPGMAPAVSTPYPATAAAQAPPTPNATAPYDRYAEYFQPPNGATVAQPAAAQAPMNQAPLNQAPMGQAPAVQTAAAQPYANQPPQQAMAPPQGAAAVQASQYAPGAGQGAYNAHASYQHQPPLPQLPPGCPPLGLDGNCPVTLVERMQWSVGDRAWGAVHRGRTYLFMGPAEREKFLANPDLYSPVLSGLDPVLAMDNQMVVAGRREYGVFGADRRIYLFADEASLKRFEANPKRYAVDGEQQVRR